MDGRPSTGPLGRHPLGGRNWEGFSADPYLAGEAIKYTVMGHQSVGVQTSSKHYIGNEQETQRTREVLDDGTVIDAVSSNIDDRTLHELYLWPFADAIKAGTTSIMCSYNRVNGTYACENEHILTGILRGELGFRGFVISDWFATHSTSGSANGGLDMEQPGDLPPGFQNTWGGSGFFGPNLEAAVGAGNVTEERLDEMVRRIMTPYFLLGQDDPEYPTVDDTMPVVLAATNNGWLAVDDKGAAVAGRDVRRDHHKLIRKMGAASSVLLKNAGKALPIRDKGEYRNGEGVSNIGVFGNAAIEPTEGLIYPSSGETPFDAEYGALSTGGGAGSGRNPYLVSPLEAIKARAHKSGAIVQYLASNEVIAKNDFRSLYPVPDVCIVFLKTWAAEEYDRVSFELDWNSTLVVTNTAAFCGNRTVVVTNSAGVNTMPWANNPNVTAILAAHYPGHEIGNSVVDVLWGDVEPSGRLPYTIPRRDEDYNLAVVNLTNADGAKELDSEKWQADFVEGQLIDYRHFDANDIDPLFEFGFGLGYTTFELGAEISVANLSGEPPSEFPDSQAWIEPGGNADLWAQLFIVTTSVRNTGRTKGHTVVQLYLSVPEGARTETTPVRALRGFEKVELRAGESRKVEFVLRRRDISYWDVEAQQWRIPLGEFGVAVGFSSRDLPRNTTFRVLG